jgi:FKBP-type peptidyl-prolyl cis-trans isomerase FkpA
MRARVTATRVRRALSLALLLGAAACGDDTILGPDPEDVTFDAALGINLSAMTKLPSGVYVQTITQGTGTATVAPTNLITIGYKGWLADGKRFDTNPRLSGLRANQFVPGFTDGVVGMKVGEVRKIVIPSRLGYGAEGAGEDIPGNAVLIFEVTLISIP